MSRPLFIFGVARSGTNLLARMLGGHPRVAIALDPLLPLMKALRNALVASRAPGYNADDCPFQDYYFTPEGPALLDAVIEGDLDAAAAPVSPATLVGAIARRATLESEPLGERLSAIGSRTFREIIDGVLSAVAQIDGGTDLAWAGCKEVWTIEFIPLLARAYPQARFIVNRRDPRAVVASLEALATRDPSQAAHTVSYMRHWRKEIAVTNALRSMPTLTGRLRVQRYEALASRPEEEGRALCEFLDIEYHPDMTELLGRDGGAWRGNSSYGELDGISMIAAARWRKVAGPGLIDAVEFHCGPEMSLCGYRCTNARPSTLDESIRDFVLAAHANPGNWRSDAAEPARDLAAEVRRWSMITGDIEPVGELEVRRHFLFETCFQAMCRLRQGSSDAVVI